MTSNFLNIKNIKLLNLEIACLIALLIFLPSFEAPKNLFLLAYVFFALLRQFKESRLTHLDKLDYIFIAFFFSALFSSLFPVLHGHEWRGFRSFVTVFLFGWVFARTEYSKQTIKTLFLVSIFALLPPLFLGLYHLLWTKELNFLLINSVGYVNASGLYLTTIASASLGYLLSLNLKRTNPYYYSFWIALIILFNFSLLEASSRSSFFALIITSMLIIIFSKISYKKIFLSMFFLILVVCFFLKAPVFEKHMINLKNHDVLSQRDKLWNVSIETLRASPSLFGIGINNYGLVDEKMIKASVEDRNVFYNPNNYFYSTLNHNVYLASIIERGLFGALILITFMLYWAGRLYGGIKLLFRGDQHFYLWAGSMTAFSSVFLVGFVHTTLVHEPGILTFFFFGLYEIYCKFYLKINKK